MLGLSVRLRAAVSAIADQVLRKGEKALAWVQCPAEQKLVVATSYQQGTSFPYNAFYLLAFENAHRPHHTGMVISPFG
jgi:hypothetical protein